MKTIIITGASGAIGGEIAKSLDQTDHRLILIYNSNKDEAIKLSRSLNCENLLVQCDFNDLSSTEAVIKNIVEKEQDIFALINCAGISLIKQIQDVETLDISRVTNINLLAPILLTKIVSRSMIKNKCGRIINISSMWGTVGASTESIYSASKGGLNIFTLALAKELGPSNITVNAICPGLIDTKMNASLTKEDIDSVIESTPLNRIGKPSDISSLVKFLLSDNASFITGQIITVDGGLTL